MKINLITLVLVFFGWSIQPATFTGKRKQYLVVVHLFVSGRLCRASVLTIHVNIGPVRKKKSNILGSISDCGVEIF